MLGTAETNVRPAGKTSVTWTPVALLGPLLVAVTTKVALDPSGTAGLDTVLASVMSAACPVTVADAELLPATASGSTSAVLAAVLVAAVVPVTVATIESVAFDPLASAPRFQ